MKIAHCQISKSGRLSLPASFRKAMGLQEGGRVVVELGDDNSVHILTQRQAIARAQAISARLLAGRPGLTVDEFLAHRREDWGEG